MVLLLAIRVLLSRRNKERDLEPPDHTFEDVYVVKVDDEGNRIEAKVDKVR